jgi:hypothetical protein
MHYNLSTPVWVGLIAVAGVAAETGIVMVVYSRRVCADRRAGWRPVVLHVPDRISAASRVCHVAAPSGTRHAHGVVAARGRHQFGRCGKTRVTAPVQRVFHKYLSALFLFSANDSAPVHEACRVRETRTSRISCGICVIKRDHAGNPTSGTADAPSDQQPGVHWERRTI